MIDMISDAIKTDIEIFETSFDAQLAEIMKAETMKELIAAHMNATIMLSTAYQFNIISLTAFNVGFDQALDQFDIRLDELAMQAI